MPKIAPVDTADEELSRKNSLFSIQGSLNAFGSAAQGVNQYFVITPRRGRRTGERYSLWWLLQPKHAKGREEESADRALPSQPAIFHQPEWRQDTPERGAVGALNSLWYSLFGIISLLQVGGKKRGPVVAKVEGDEEDFDDDMEDMVDEAGVAHVNSGVPEFPLGILNPRSLMMLYWNLAIVLLICFNLSFCPARLAFEAMQINIRVNSTDPSWGVWNSYSLYIEYGVDAFFALDVLVQLRTAFFKESEGEYKLVVAQSDVTKRNLSRWFLPDMAVGFPYEFIWNLEYHFSGMPLQPPKYWFSLVRFARMVKLFKLRQLFVLTRVGNLDHHISSLKERIVLSRGPLGVMIFFGAFVYALHCMSCLLFLVAVWFDEFLKDSWIRHVGMVTTSTELMPDGSIRQYSSKRMLIDIDLPVKDQYLASLYYMTTTLTQVGYGDFLPKSFYECALLTITMVVGAGIFSFIVSNTEQFMTDLGGVDVELRDKIEEITRLLFEVISSTTVSAELSVPQDTFISPISVFSLQFFECPFLPFVCKISLYSLSQIAMCCPPTGSPQSACSPFTS